MRGFEDRRGNAEKENPAEGLTLMLKSLLEQYGSKA